MTQKIGVGKLESQKTFMLSIVLRCSKIQGGGYNSINCRRKFVYLELICEKKNWYVMSHSIIFHSKLLGSFV